MPFGVYQWSDVGLLGRSEVRGQVTDLSEIRTVRTVPPPREIPVGTSDYIADSIRRRRLEAVQARVLNRTLRELGFDERTAATKLWGMQVLREAGYDGEFRNGTPYYPQPTPEEVAERRRLSDLRQSMRGYRGGIRSRVRRQHLSGALIEDVSREEIIERDGLVCYLCERVDLKLSEIHLDHVIPLSRGGDHTRENLRVSCADCNIEKGVLTEAEYRARLSARSRCRTNE